MDVSQYLEIFIDEAKEHLENLNTQIMNLEQDGENPDTINEIFRAAHSLADARYGERILRSAQRQRQSQHRDD